MTRIAGIDIPEHKRTDIALTYIYGIGRSNVKALLKEANIDAAKRAKDLNEDEINRLQKIIEQTLQVEGNLHRLVLNNIKRLKEIGAYRGIRHTRNLPVRGQRTRANARTKRGKRMTIGALKKDDRAKIATPGASAEKK
ncbi:TPA: 30S ribosomal protein S13 [Patescibacteria group bacterium]|uniref:Small ribosomal subunit protein uS13 n=1 Tax=Candidatus Gottesmanbacteria bacterium GW2011_GWA1_43_11 TaxID=1618436 RepID=A0A0G1ENN4_9BACT|nr:MAG: 30S ribosomal protein S13 [Candidatus Gottesmanbacteria bacterium GW2011_GWA1_43_11]HCS78607.1 30S ribosomal protein S13 [Patescibacteria group bacterium]